MTTTRNGARMPTTGVVIRVKTTETNHATTETMEERLDRLEAMLVGVADRLDRLSDAVTVPLCLQERSLRRLARSLDSLQSRGTGERPARP